MKGFAVLLSFCLAALPVVAEESKSKFGTRYTDCPNGFKSKPKVPSPKNVSTAPIPKPVPLHSKKQAKSNQ